MARNIVLCLDGTSNQYSATNTNVVKLYAMLDRARNDQLSYYQPGIGTFAPPGVWGRLKQWFITRLDLAIAWLLSDHVQDAYRYLMRYYQEGDQIFIFGFSRGAYTARALAGMISAKGLLDGKRFDLTDKEAAYRLGTAVWFASRKVALQGDPDRLSNLLGAILDFPVFLLHPPSDDQLLPAPIEAVAVWDTVGALGIPVYNERLIRLDVFRFADTKLSGNVRAGRHAVAIDEERADFNPTLWDDDPRVIQVLFPGAHADVGGGYRLEDSESGLSDGALVWMTEELNGLGVRFSADPMVVPHPDPSGTAHRPWAHLPFDKLPRGPRTFPNGLCLSRSVLDRIGGNAVKADPGLQAAAYAPGNLSDYIAGRVAAAGITVV